MRPDSIVVISPGLGDRAGRGKAHELVLVEALVAQLPIEALDVRVLHGLAGVDKMQVNPTGIRPHIQGSSANSGPLSTVIESGGPRSMASRSKTRVTRRLGNQASTSVARLGVAIQALARERSEPIDLYTIPSRLRRLLVPTETGPIGRRRR